MKKIAAALAFGVCMAAGAAFANTMESAYGNTVVITNAQGESRYHFNADGSLVIHTPNGALNATYHVHGEHICITPAGGSEACSPYVAGKNVGDSWTQPAADGGEIQVRIEAGR